MSVRPEQFPASYSLFDELATPQQTPVDYPESYSMFDTLTKAAQPQPESYQLFDQVASASAPMQEIPTENAASKSLAVQSPEQPGKGVLDSFGRALAMQSQMQFQPEAIPQLGAGALEGVTLGAVDVAQPKTGGGKVFREVGRLGGLTGPVKLIHRVFRPLGLWGRLAGAASAGAAVEAGREYFKEGEVEPKEVLKEAAIWTGLEGSLLLGQMVSFIAKASGKKPTDVMRFLWDKAKGKLKKPFKTAPTEEDVLSGNVDLNPEVEETFVKEAQKEVEALEKQGLKPQEEAKAGPSVVPPQKPTKKEPEAPKEGIEPIAPEIAEKKLSPEVKKAVEPSKVPTLKEVQEATRSIYGEKPTSKVISEKVHDAIKSGNYNPILHPSLKQPREIFENLTGVKLPDTVIGTKEALNNYKETLTPTQPLAAKHPEIKPPVASYRKPIIGTEQAKKRSDILNQFRKAFKDPLRLGKLSPKQKKMRAAGIHKVWEKVSRLVQDNDIETAAHEIGHNLHTTLYGGDASDVKGALANVDKALEPFAKELTPLARYEPYLSEGFAEFTRTYVTNPEFAEKTAPNFYRKFEAGLDMEYPELKNALLEARDYYDKWLKGTPESRIDAQISYAEPKGFIDKLVSPFTEDNLLDKLKFQILDDLFPLKRMMADLFGIKTAEVENLKDPRNVYRAARVLKGAIGKADVFLEHETFDFKTLKKTGKGLKEILSGLNDQQLKELTRYMVSLRAIEKMSQGFETGLNAEDVQQMVKDLHKKYNPIAKELDGYQDRVLQYYRDAGMLSNNQYKAIKEKNLFYIPWHRIAHPESEKGRGRVSGGGKLQAKQVVKKFKGSAADIVDPLESIVKNTYSLIMEAEKNHVGQILGTLAKTVHGAGRYVERVPSQRVLQAKFSKEKILETIKDKMTLPDGSTLATDAEIDLLDRLLPDALERWGARKPSGNIITVWHGGKPLYYEVSPEIHQVWEKGLAPYSANLITKALRIPARTLRAGAILNPRFIQKNIVRDTWATALFTKYGPEGVKMGQMLLDAIYDPIKGLIAAAGQGPLYVEWLKAGGGLGTMQSLDRASVVKKLEEVRKGLKPHQVIGWLRKFSEVSEEANRLAEFARAIDREQSSRIGKEIAAFAARDISIDYAKIGMLTKAANQVIPFWNATVQGGDKLIRTLSNPEDRNEFLLRGLIFVVLPSLMLAWLNQDDESVQEQSETTRDFNFLFGLPGGDVLQIPVPFESGVLMHGLTQRMYKYFMEKDPKAFEGFMGSILEASVPDFLPVAASPFIETWANKSFFTGRRIVPLGKESLIPELQYKNYTSQTARLLGRAISYMIGPEKAGKYSSPAIIDHFVNSWTGGLGNLAVRLSDASLRAAGLDDKIPKPDEAIIDKLGLNAFIKRFPNAGSNSIEKFYDNYARASRIKKSLKQYEKLGIEEGYERLERLNTYPAIQAAYRAMKKSQNEINRIFIDPEIVSEEKKQMIDELYWQQIRFAREVNKDIETFLKENK